MIYYTSWMPISLLFCDSLIYDRREDQLACAFPSYYQGVKSIYTTDLMSLLLDRYPDASCVPVYVCLSCFSLARTTRSIDPDRLFLPPKIIIIFYHFFLLLLKTTFPIFGKFKYHVGCNVGCHEEARSKDKIKVHFLSFTSPICL